MAIKERAKTQVSQDNDLVESLRNDKEFMDGVLEGFEDYKNGRMELWSHIKRELDLDQ